MIKVNGINDNGGFSPETTPTEFKGSHFDGEYFYFFESEQEQIDFFAALPVVWSKEAHIAEINALHSDEFKRRYLALKYEDGWDVHLYAERPELGFQEEARELLKYWTDGFAAIIAYGEKLTEQPTETPQEFFNQLNSTL